ncbi:MAG: hypothetical protein SGJ02_01260 [bacterium]|nr:hypothetical protein [bacterium]
MYTGNTLAWDYNLTYTHDSVTEEDRLDEIKQCEANGSCLPKISFSWGITGDINLLYGENLQTIPVVGGYTNAGTHPVIIGDWNRDGLTDLGRIGYAGTKTCLSTGDSRFDRCFHLSAVHICCS